MDPSQKQNHGSVWVTGAAGLIGGELLRLAPRANAFRVIGLKRQELDLTDRDAVRRRFEKDQPRAIIHCAALSRSPICETNPELARVTNVEATRHLVELAPQTRLLFLSTDLVFDGSRGAYREEDSVNPLSVYARTKVEAEAVVRGMLVI